MLDPSKIRAISIDLDDTLWPIWPTIERAERVLLQWLFDHAPRTAALHADAAVRVEIREQLHLDRPDLRHDFSGLRLETIRMALRRGLDDPSLAEQAFEVFFAERQRVDLFPDALPALEFLASRWPVIALSNGNADVHRVGIGRFFKGRIAAREIGVGKPDRRIFEAAANAAHVPAGEMLHIGDDPTLDALGALNAGMQAAWLNRDGRPWEHEPLPQLDVRDLDHICDELR